MTAWGSLRDIRRETVRLDPPPAATPRVPVARTAADTPAAWVPPPSAATPAEPVASPNSPVPAKVAS